MKTVDPKIPNPHQPRQSLLPGLLKLSSHVPPRLILTTLVLAYFIFCGLYASQRHLAFETSVFDTGVYTQPLWNFLQGRDFAVSTIEDNGPIRWATHVEPILFFILPLYALWPDPRTLYWLQAAALSLAAVPLYALARRRLGNEWLALAIAIAYLLLPATQSVTLFDFHAVTFAPLFLLSAIYFLDRALAAQGVSFWLWPALSIKAAKKNPIGLYLLSGLFFLLALSTKEDISLHVFMIGLYLLILRRRWQEGGLLVIVGLVWFYVTFQVIIPAYRTGGGHSIYAAWFETLGNTPLEIALSPLTKPDQVLALVFRPGSIPALTMITLPLALLPWAGLPLFGLTAPSLAFSLLSQNPTLRQLETWHYAAPMLALIMLGTIDGLARISHYSAWLISRYSPSQRLRRAVIRPILAAGLAVLLVGVGLAYQTVRGYTPLSQLYRWPQVTTHHDLGRQIAATIPEEASVLAQAELIPYVAHRERLGIWSGPLLTDYDYIWLDLSHPKLPNRFGAHDDLLIGLIYEHAFGPVAMTDGYLLLKNGAERVPISEALFSFTRFDKLPAQAQTFDATFGEEIRLIGLQTDLPRLATSTDEPQLVLYFETLQAPAQDYYLFVYRLNEAGVIDGATDYAQPSIFWWSTSRWQPGDRQQVRINSVPWWSGDQRVFGYAVGFSRSDDPWNIAARLPIRLGQTTANLPGLTTIDQGTLLPVAAFRRQAVPDLASFRATTGLVYPEPLTTLELNNELPRVAN